MHTHTEVRAINGERQKERKGWKRERELREGGGEGRGNNTAVPVQQATAIKHACSLYFRINVEFDILEGSVMKPIH